MDIGFGEDHRTYNSTFRLSAQVCKDDERAAEGMSSEVM